MTKNSKNTNDFFIDINHKDIHKYCQPPRFGTIGRVSVVHITPQVVNRATL